MLVPSIILHEVSHGVVAFVFGDDTAKRAGRLTLNPIRHIDPFGTIILPAMLVLAGAAGVRLRQARAGQPVAAAPPPHHGLLVSLAGPATNFLIAGGRCRRPLRR